MAKYVPTEKEIAEVSKAVEEAMKQKDKQKLMNLRGIIENWKEDKDHGDVEKVLKKLR